MMFYAYYNQGELSLQKEEYIEDGWYIQSYQGAWQLWVIPEYGGEEYCHGIYNSIEEVINAAVLKDTTL